MKRSPAVRLAIGSICAVAMAVGAPSYASGHRSLGAAPAQSQTSTWLMEQDGDFHACGVKSDATVWCWKQGTPVQVGSDDDWTSIGVGGGHLCGVRADHTLWCWGSSTHGGLGLGDGVHRRLEPTQVGRKANWLSVTAGGGDSCGIRLNGSLWCWGVNNYYELGVGDTEDRFRPTLVAAGSSWREVSVKGLISCGVRRNGTGWCWGYERGTVPARVDDRSDWAMISVGSASCGIRTDQTLWCWGINPYGQLGDGTTQPHASPEQIGSETWRSVAMGIWHTCGVQASGTLWCWGWGGNGQLGQGHDLVEVHVPTQVGDSTSWDRVSAAEMVSHAIDQSGQLYGWGDCFSDLGLDCDSDALVPTLIPG